MKLIRIYQIARKFNKLPTDILFPNLQSSLIKLVIDNLIFEYGFQEEIDLEIKREENKIKLDNQRLEILIKALASR